MDSFAAASSAPAALDDDAGDDDDLEVIELKDDTSAEAADDKYPAGWLSEYSTLDLNGIRDLAAASGGGYDDGGELSTRSIYRNFMILEHF